jgi:hypothetical protein
MKSFTSVVLAASILLVPLSGFAQQSASMITRAQVRAELIQLEKAGYTPAWEVPKTAPTQGSAPAVQWPALAWALSAFVRRISAVEEENMQPARWQIPAGCKVTHTQPHWAALARTWLKASARSIDDAQSRQATLAPSRASRYQSGTRRVRHSRGSSVPARSV